MTPSFLKIDIVSELPYLAFVKYWQKNGQSGKIGDWKFFFHGFHCYFENIFTNQCIEVPIVFGFEFGDLDPYFFMQYIKSMQMQTVIQTGTTLRRSTNRSV